MKHPLIFILATAVAVAAEPSPLDQPIGALRFEKAPLPAALRTLGRAGGKTILIEPEITGEVTADIPGGTLRSALVVLTEPAGFYFEETAAGIAVRQRKTVLYAIDYPQLTRSGSGSASITLGGATGGGTNGYPGTLPLAQQQNLNTGNTASDATQVSISQENQNTFWTTLESELRAMLKDGDSLVLNRFSGVAQITAPMKRHETMSAFIELVNRRITQQVEIEARLVEVTLRDEQKLGVDWDLAATSVEGARVQAASPVDLTGVGGTLLGANTFAATLGLGKATAVIHALKQQGDVKTVAQPRLRALNNQTAFIKVGEDRPFFRLQQTTTLQQPGATTAFNQTQENFSVSTITIGTILAVTPQIDGNNTITLDVLPAITRLQAIVTSPDGRQTAPVTEVKQASTIVRLRDGETAIIGGLISEETGETVRGVPVIGRVPVIGAAFRSKANLRARTELVIFLTPRIVR
ncbi:MAG: secretin N-terminal domain-containing protein [Opitutaceae bacterium]|nr:secretin N-terminal domain-containing protein [Opitutaceae bacterium]